MIPLDALGIAAIGSVYCIGECIKRNGMYCSPKGGATPLSNRRPPARVVGPALASTNLTQFDNY